MAHRVRESVSQKTPLHINFKYCTYIKKKNCLKLLKRAIVNARRFGLRINHFSLQTNHIHLIVEAETNEILTKGMRSLTITFAKGLKEGKVQIERYHLHVLKTLRETQNALKYVLFNKQKHDKGTYSAVDEYSSLLGMREALKFIQSFAKTHKITLRLGPKGDFRSDRAISHLLKRALIVTSV